MSNTDDVLIRTNQRMMLLADYTADDGNFLEGIIILKNVQR